MQPDGFVVQRRSTRPARQSVYEIGRRRGPWLHLLKNHKWKIKKYFDVRCPPCIFLKWLSGCGWWKKWRLRVRGVGGSKLKKINERERNICRAFWSNFSLFFGVSLNDDFSDINMILNLVNHTGSLLGKIEFVNLKWLESNEWHGHITQVYSFYIYLVYFYTNTQQSFSRSYPVFLPLFLKFSEHLLLIGASSCRRPAASCCCSSCPPAGRSRCTYF